MISIQTNVDSLIAQQNLNINNEFQSQTIQQLTSGYRINSSGDDAAGLAVANQYRSSVAELTQGVANGNDGQAQLQIMDGGMSNISQILDRLKTLATQSASGTFTGSRTTVNAEFQNDISEINRQAQSIGLNTGGTFNKNLDVYLGQGSGSQSLQNGIVTLNLSGSAVDSQALGLMGMEAVNVSGSLSGTNTGTDIGSTSATSVQNIVSNTSGGNANQEATAGYAALSFSGAGFSDAGAIPISVNLAGVTDTSTLVTAVNNAIQAAGSGSTAAATAFKNANIVASVHTDSNGGQELAFTSSTSAFQVQAGDQMGNALLGNVSVVDNVAQGVAVSGTAATAVTGADTTNGNFAQNQVVKLVVNGGGLASPVTLQVNTGAGTVSTSAAITQLENQFGSNSTLAAAGLSMSGSPTPGGALSFNSANGSGFNIQVTGDTSNLLGLGSFQADSSGNADYSTITAGSAYSAAAVTGNSTTTGLAAGLEISLNGQASTALTGVDLTTGAHATAASASSSSAVGTGAVDITAANQNLSITVVNNGVVTNAAFALNTNQVATAGAEASTVTSANISGSPITIAAASHNNQFTLAVDGGAATTLTVADGTYSTSASFLTAVQTAISGSALNGDVTAGWDPTSNALTFTSATTGATSSVTVGTATYATAATSWSDTTQTGIVGSPITVAAASTNNKFNVAVDGGASVTLTVADGTYSTAAAFLTAIQTAISGSSLNGDVTAGWNPTSGALTLTSATTGAASSLAMSAAAGNTGLANLGWDPSTNHGTAATNNTGVTNIGLTSGATNSGVNDAPSTVQSIASQIQTQLGSAAVVTVTNGNLLSIASASKGANSSVTINTPDTDSANATLNLTTPTTVAGQNSSIADIVSNLNAQFAASSTYQAAGLTAAATASNGLGNGSYITISSNNGTQFRLDALGGGGAATSGAVASTATTTSLASSPITVTANTNDKFKIAVDGGAAVTVQVAANTYSSATALAAAINTAIGNTALTGEVTAGVNATTGAVTLTSATTGNNSSVALTAVNANTGLSALGFSATSGSGQQASAAENAGFGTTGASFTAAALATAGANASSTGTSLSTLAANGISNSTPFSFSALQYGSDKQALTFSATDANGVLESKTITLQNNTGEGGNTAGASIDASVAYINQQLQSSTSNPALQQIVAVKENVDGAEQINFVSSLNNFTVGVSSTANADGLNGGAAVQRASQANGSASTMSVDTQSNAEAAITAITNAVAQLGSAQAAVGKGENQLNYAVTLAQSQITNFSAAESQIRDADIASEAANLSKGQVLQQSTIAAMAQANSAPQAVLKLLQG